MDELSALILKELKRKPNQKVESIASNLSADQKKINNRLHFILTSQVKKNADSSWTLVEQRSSQNIDNSITPQLNENFAFDSLQAIRNRLLDLTGNNRLLNFKHGKSGFIRVIDEMPDQLYQSN